MSGYVADKVLVLTTTMYLLLQVLLGYVDYATMLLGITLFGLNLMVHIATVADEEWKLLAGVAKFGNLICLISTLLCIIYFLYIGESNKMIVLLSVGVWSFGISQCIVTHAHNEIKKSEV